MRILHMTVLGRKPGESLQAERASVNMTFSQPLNCSIMQNLRNLVPSLAR